MTFWKPMVVALVLGSAAVSGAVAGASPKPVDGAVIVPPFAGLALDAGSKHVVGYYVAADGGCKVTIAIAERFRDNAELPAAGSRLIATVAGGQSARVDTAEGPSLEFMCAPGAKTMTGRVLERTAFVPAAK